MSIATVATQPDLTLRKLQLFVQQQEGNFGPLTQISASDGRNVIEFEARARPRGRAFLKQLGKDQPIPKKGYVIVCEGECFISGRTTRVAPFRAEHK